MGAARFAIVVPVFMLTSCTLFELALHIVHPIEISLSTGSIAASPNPADHGAVFNLKISNSGAEEHDFALLKTEYPADGLPLWKGEPRFWTYDGEPMILVLYSNTPYIAKVAIPGNEQEAIDWMREAGSIRVNPGETVEKEYTHEALTSGHSPYSEHLIMLCCLRGHYEAGEFADLIIK